MSSAPQAPKAGAGAEKKGEVNELRQLLRTVNTEKDSKRKRDVIKKVIAYMTLGIDVSRLFSEMVLASNTKDLVIKKMVYLYLCSYAQSNPELTLLAINTLQKDCRDEDPMVRGLALRSLTGLRLSSILEYVTSPLRAALSDSSGYVRQAGVVGILKVFHLSPALVKEGDYIDLLYTMIRDREPQVVINCINTLNEILAEEGGVAVNQPMIHYLLTRIREFSDWGQCIVMDLVTRYTPANEDELFGIMNLLDPCLKVANSAVVLGCTKCFIRLTSGLPEVQQQVYLRLKTPLLTLIASSGNEIAYALLCHVNLIADRAPSIFDEDFKQFFCKYNEPGSVKSLKMGILPKIANASNAREIVAELAEYVGGVDAEIARQAVRAIAEIAIRVPAAADTVVESLLDSLEMDAEYVRAETVVVLQDLLRKYPDKSCHVIPSLHRCLKRMEGPSGRAAVIWMIGEYGALIEDAPYLLEPLIDSISTEDSVVVRNELLAATLKLFFKRPPEMQKMMGRLFKFCLSESNVAASVHDRALLYYRLLRTNVRDAAAVINGERPSVSSFHDEQSADVKEKIFSEFNTLSVLYNKPSEQFVSADHLIVPLDAPGLRPKLATASDGDGLLSGADGSEHGSTPGGPASTATSADPFGEDLLGIGAGFSPSTGTTSSQPAQAAAPFFRPSAPLEASTFQQKWGALPTTHNGTLRLARVPSAPEFEGALRAAHLSTIASGDIGMALKFYFSAHDQSGSPALIEMVVDKGAATVTTTIKTENPGAGAPAAQFLTGHLRPFLA